jgi:hypothetical protein
MANETRRSFLKKAGTALTAGAVFDLNPSAFGANKKIMLTLIGGNNQGRGVAFQP